MRRKFRGVLCASVLGAFLAGLMTLALNFLGTLRGPGLRSGLVALATLALTSCSDESYDFDDAACVEAIRAGDNNRATEWLRTAGPIPKQFGRFSTNGSLSMASLFESYGATGVWVSEISKIKGDDPAMSASVIVIGLPTDPKLRHQVFVMYAKEARLEEYAPHADTGQRYLLLRFRR